MGIASIPAPAVGGDAEVAFTATIDLVSTMYEHPVELSTGIYECNVVPSSTDARIIFCSDTTRVLATNTTSGSVIANVIGDITTLFIQTKAGGTAGATVTLTRVASAIASDDIGNGTLDTINTTGTYNQTGVLGILVLSGGRMGESKPQNNNLRGGDGGRAGFINGDIAITNAATTVTIGAKGVASLTTPTEPTNSSFGNLVTATTANNVFTNGNGGGGDYYNATAGNASTIFLSWNSNSTTGGGGGANRTSSNNGANGAGSGIGTGGDSVAGANPTTRGGSGTGKASGGAGGRPGANTTAQLAGDGADGVVFVLRGF